MRSVLDPKRHYKKENGKAQPPKYSQVGTIIEGRTEFFSGRIAKKDRKKTFVEEVLDQERHNKRFESNRQAERQEILLQTPASQEKSKRQVIRLMLLLHG